MSIEERLARDIAAVTKGVIVTESELLEARSALDDRIDSKRQRDRRKTVVAVAAAAVVVAGASVIGFQALGGDSETAVAADPTPVVDSYADWFTGALPTPQLLEGVWREDNGAVSMLFGEDGTVQLDDQGNVYSNPGAWGTYEIDGDTVTMTFAGGAACEGTQQSMRASVTKEGTLRALPDDASGGACSPLGTYQSVWEHVLPTGKQLDNLNFSNLSGWQPLTDQRALTGDWTAEGGGYVLEMTPQGTYYILDESVEPIDQGQWSLQAGDLALTSAASSTSCNKGDRLVMSNVQTVNDGTPAIRGSVEENSCNGTWTPKAWFLLPNAASQS